VSRPNYDDWKKDVSSLELMTAFFTDDYNLSGTGDAERLRGVQVSADFFPLFGAAPQVGRRFGAETYASKQAQEAIISHALWQRRFGGAPVLGTTMNLDGSSTPSSACSARLRAPRLPAGAGLPPLRPRQPRPRWARQPLPQRLCAHRADGDARHRQRRAGSPGRHAAHRLPRGDEQARRLDRAGARAPDQAGARGHLAALRRRGAGAAHRLRNVANMLINRAAQREGEIAVRVALGASRGRLIRLLLTEGAVLALIGGGLGLLLAVWGVDFTTSAMRVAPVFRPGIDARVFGFAALAAVGSVLFFALAPALRATRVDLAGALKESGGKVAGGRSLLRSTLVVAQIALSFALLVGAGLLVRSFENLAGVAPGFDPRKQHRHADLAQRRQVPGRRRRRRLLP
jgi:hypothetical protein